MAITITSNRLRPLATLNELWSCGAWPICDFYLSLAHRQNAFTLFVCRLLRAYDNIAEILEGAEGQCDGRDRHIS